MPPAIEEHILSWITFLPLLTGLGLLSTGMVASFLLGSHGLSASSWRLIGIGASAIDFGLAVFGAWGRFDPEAGGFQLVERLAWLPGFGINYFVGVDGISLLLVLLTSFLVPLVMLASWKQPARFVRSYVFFTLWLETCLIGSFVALNLFQFHVSCEMALVPMFFAIGIWGGEGRVRSASRFLISSAVASLLMLLAVGVLAALNLEQNRALLGDAAHWNLDLVLAAGDEGVALLGTQVPVSGEFWWKTQAWLFGAFALGLSIKLAVFPLHAWLSDAHAHGPSFASVLLASLFAPLGGYGFLRFALVLFPQAAASDAATTLFVTLAATGIACASLLALVQSDLKRLVGYLSLAQLCFVTLGIFSLDSHGLSGSVIQLVAQGLSVSALLLAVGFLHERRHTRDIGAFEGLARVMPVHAACFGVLAMASIGVPAFGPFVGQFLILLGTFASSPLAALAAAGALVLMAVSVTSMLRSVLFGPVEHDENRGLLDLGARERIVMFALIVPIVWIGVYPNPLLRRVEPAVIEVLEGMRQRGAALEERPRWSPSWPSPPQAEAAADSPAPAGPPVEAP
jgi:NADH-quinone oxidoreductase subunit M